MESANTIANFTAELLADDGARPQQLLQYLCRIQYRFSFIPQESIDLLAAKLGLPVSRIQGVIAFYSFLHETPRGDYDILFSDSITDHMLGSRALMQDLCDKLVIQAGIPRDDGRVSVDVTSCTGMCDQGPALLVNGWTVTCLDKVEVLLSAKAREVSRAVITYGLDMNNTPVQDLICCIISGTEH